MLRSEEIEIIKQDLAAADDLREQQRERFDVPDPQAEAWQAECKRLDLISAQLSTERRAVGRMMRRLIECRDNWHRDFDGMLEIENAQIVGMCEWLLRVLRPRVANLKEQHEAAKRAWITCVGNRSQFGRGA